MLRYCFTKKKLNSNEPYKNKDNTPLCSMGFWLDGTAIVTSKSLYFLIRAPMEVRAKFAPTRRGHIHSHLKTSKAKAATSSKLHWIQAAKISQLCMVFFRAEASFTKERTTAEIMFGKVAAERFNKCSTK